MAGWAALPSIKIETDPSQLVSANDAALIQAETVRKEIGLTGEIDLMVQGPDPAAPDAVKWLDQASRNAAAQSGGDLKPLESLPAFLAGFNQGTLPDPDRSALILSRIPSYFSGAVYDKSQGLALAIFGLTHVTSVERDHVLVAGLDRVASPPSGYRAFPAGLAVVADRALSGLQGEQLRLTGLSIGLILLVLLLAYRRLRPAILAILPTVVAAGAATGLLFLVDSLFGQRSSPITILLGGVVVAFATEFGVLWLRCGTSASGALSISSSQPPRCSSFCHRSRDAGTPDALFALPAGLALLGEGVEPLFRVGSLEETEDAFPLQRQSALERNLEPLLRHQLDLADGDPGTARQGGRERDRLRQQPVRGEQPIDDPQLRRSLRVQRLAGQDQLHRLLPADQAWQALGAAVSR